MNYQCLSTPLPRLLLHYGFTCSDAVFMHLLEILQCQFTLLTFWQEEELRGAVVLIFANKQVCAAAVLFIPKVLSVQEKISCLTRL
jgi:hypothetical protein